ncbi:DUF3987 domain-containing protein [Mesorhizobium sp. B2-3-10]|uniref:DUF3987 domain-containing protein n=1 Tax=Mesorhizobium sp. B2-3-10 TaxID=2589954 RepID=UPI00112C114F|nr:DUF3987 domain-containing protein [Mesorhizobium sp. B2-3-10]TPM04527.1 DUF3987 domain-containing protein [Mesorhizobium sp. B2-3-10]
MMDFDSINAAAMSALPSLLASWLKGGRRSGHEWIALNPTRADHHAGSFRVNMKTGKWADFAAGDKGGDPISLAAYLFGLSQTEAADRLAAMLGISDRGAKIMDKTFAPRDEKAWASDHPVNHGDNQWSPMLPVPADAAALTTDLIRRCAPEGYVCNTCWRYVDAQGRLLGYVVRYDRPANGLPADKQVKPFTFCELPGGKREWRCKGFPDPRPLYGLDRLAARPEAPVLVVEGEKTADAAERRFSDHVVITTSGGSNAARKADWRAVAGRRLTIWPDNNDPGKTYAAEAADMARNAGAAVVRTVNLPEGLPKGWDLADDLPVGLTDADVVAALTEARPAAADGPIPLFPSVPEAERFPIEALGPVLSRAAAAISRKVQVPEAIAAQSVLAVAALASQAHADVMLPYGQTRPLSLFFVTVAASGDRKSSADNEALWPIRKRETVLREEHENEHCLWSIAIAAWNAEKKKIEGNRKMDFDARRAALTNLGPEPKRPLHPFLTAPEPTIEGLVKAWSTAPAALGIFTAEGGMFIGGHGMSQDNRLRTAAGYSQMWDGHPIKRIRSLDGVSILYGRRLSMHLMVQHAVAAQFLADSQLRDQGLLSRVLVTSPESIAGTRFYRDAEPEDNAAILSYGERILSILESPWPLAEGRKNELEPRALTIGDDAAKSWRAFHDHVEGQCGPGKDLWPVQDFAAKIAEHAARIAGVLTIVEDVRATKIGIETMHSALMLADWYLNETVRLQRVNRLDPKLLAAQKLLDWMLARDEATISFREIVQSGPNPFRTKNAAEAALSTLSAHGWVTEVSARPRKIRLVRET